MIKAIVFDCFGVLITDSLELIVSELRQTKPDIAEQITYTANAASKGLISRQESIETVAGLLGISAEEYLARRLQGEAKDQRLLDYIAELRKQYKTAVLSNVSIGGLAVRFTQDELDTYFDAVVVSGEVGYAKPEAEAYEIAADRLGVRLDECVFVDDREVYCAGAKAVGMQPILYTSLQQLQQDLQPLL